MTSLTLRLVEIPEAGLVIDETASLAVLREILHVEEEDAFQPVSPLAMSLRVTKLNKRVTVAGQVHLTVSFVCSRCGKAGERDVKVRIKETFLPVEKFVTPTKRNVDLDPQDFRFAYYEHDELDLGAYLGESVLLELPMFPTCQDSDACTGDTVVWREDWDEEAEARKESNPAWREQLSLAKEVFEASGNEENDSDEAPEP